jgi:transposase-like protein
MEFPIATWKKIMEEREAEVDHATLNRWVVKFAPLMAAQAQSRKKPTAKSWRMDETYIKVKGKWTYYYRAVDNTRKTLDFMLSEPRDKAVARRFSSAPLARMACLTVSSSTRAVPIWRVCKASM